jgi:antitoxin HicB
MKTTKPEEYLKKPYARILTPDENGGFYAEILEFPGCFAEGETPNETFEALERAAQSWIEAALERDQEIPEPSTSQGYAGKVALRLPRSIHRRAAQMAERDRTSLNQFLVSSIAERIGAEDLYSKIAEKFAGRFICTINMEKSLTNNFIFGAFPSLGNLEPTVTLSAGPSSLDIPWPMAFLTAISIAQQKEKSDG